MKKFLSMILALTFILSALLTLASCEEEEYPPVESTDEEAAVLMTFELEGEEYELKYELYRALFLNLSKNYDGGDKSFWQTADAAEAKSEINAAIVDYALDIFAALHLSKKIGYDPYSKDAEEKISAYVKESVEGDGGEIEGFGGDYDAYLASLREMNLNYSAQTLLLRYAIAYDKLVEYYTGTASKDNPTPDMESGKLEYTRDDVIAFYNGDDSARVSITTINALYLSRETAEQRRDKIASFSTAEEALLYAVTFTAGDPDDILEGAIIGKNSMDAAYYSAVTEAAFALSEGETSEVIEVITDERTEYWILYKMEKTEDYLNDSFDKIESVYISERIGQILLGVKNSLSQSVTESEDFKSLDYSAISMK